MDTMKKVLIFSLILVSGLYGQSVTPKIGGLYEICIGVTDPLPEIQYWEAFGYRIGSIGELTKKQAESLYNVKSDLKSIRLLHGDSDHGLIRLMVWDEPVNEGLGMVRLMTPGSRWASALTNDVMTIYNHAELAQTMKMKIHVIPPQWGQIYEIKDAKPFVGDLAGVRELIVLTPLKRRMFFQRFGYSIPNYGQVNEESKFKASQITHVGLVFQSDDSSHSEFYSDVLELQKREGERKRTYDDLVQSSRNIYGMKEGEVYFGSSYENPSNTPGDFMTAKSGVLLLRRVPKSQKEPNLTDRSRPGCLGLSLYTFRVTDIGYFHKRVSDSVATQVTEIQSNEFGESCFSFFAPDGSYWTLVGPNEKGR